MTQLRRTAHALLILATGLSPVAAARAAGDQQAGDPSVGRDVARTWCSSCHLVSGTGQTTAGDAVPPFATIAKRPDATPEKLAAFLQKPHGRMPDFALDENQIKDVVAYLLTLK